MKIVTKKYMLLSPLRTCFLQEIGFSGDKTLSLPETTCQNFQAWMFYVLKIKILCISCYPRSFLTLQSDVSWILGMFGTVQPQKGISVHSKSES